MFTKEHYKEEIRKRKEHLKDLGDELKALKIKKDELFSRIELIKYAIDEEKEVIEMFLEDLNERK